MVVIDTITADTVQNGDVIEYVTPKGKTRTLAVTGEPEDNGTHILVTGIPEDIAGNEKVTVRFEPDDYVDLLGA
jgi:hypothetical protein